MDNSKVARGRNSAVASILLASVMAAVPLSAAAVDDMFLKLRDIRGESGDPDHRFEIELLSYTQSMTGPFARGATSAAAGKAVCGMLTIVKYVDAASPDLVLSALNGRHIPEAVITFRRPGPKPFEYYKVTLEDVIVTEVEQNDSKLNFPNPAPPSATEKVTLMARRFRYEYTAQDPRTGGKAGQPKAGWDCVAASKA
jgi:type VI secretion system secreted protein Hcp